MNNRDVKLIAIVLAILVVIVVATRGTDLDVMRGGSTFTYYAIMAVLLLGAMAWFNQNR